MHPNQQQRTHQQKRVTNFAANSDSYCFFNLLTGEDFFEQVESLLPEHRERLFPPTETLSLFLAQVMAADRSCQNAVNDAAIKRLVGGLSDCSTHTGAYCKARQRLPLDMVSTLTRYSGQMTSKQCPENWHWRGRPIKLVDGVTAVMPDTPENQEAYPQSVNQASGLGFPLCRMVAIICHASGSVLDMAMGSYNGKGSDEQSLLRRILGTLNQGDVLIGDAFYATYFLLCTLQAAGIDGVFEQLGARKRVTDFRRGRSLGQRDHIITLFKPSKKPDWMEQVDYDQAPNSIKIRELHTGQKILVTTMLCPRQVSKAELKKLYRERWHIELDLRNIKTTMGMEMLSCKTPKMVEKEIWVHLLAYNLVRLLMAQSALLADILPRQLSFKHTLQLWNSWCLHQVNNDDFNLEKLFFFMAQRVVGKRPGRIEPRAIKRRPKPFPLLTKSRHEAQQDIRKNGRPKKIR
ncbi:MAG: IS4 family transposase [Gammaproteobacteria bacterium]